MFAIKIAAFLFLFLFGCAPVAKPELTTIEGIYEESKAGPVVDGVILLGQPFEEQYRGKQVEATGELREDHEWKCKPYVPEEPVEQCFDGPVLLKATVRPK